jgi:uncharacterized protein YkwD
MKLYWSKLILSILMAGDVVACHSLTNTFPAVSVSQSTPVTLADTASLSTIEQNIYQQINQHRQSLNLPPLQLNQTLAQEARIHSERMAAKTIPFSHQGFEQRTQQISRTIPYQEVAENVSVNQNAKDPGATAVQSWLKSSQHRQSIEGDFDLTGIGVARNSQGEYYFTQIFIKQRQISSSPSPSSSTIMLNCNPA